jgi:UrcA family protein
MNKLTLAIAALALSGAAAAEDHAFSWAPEDLVTLESIAATHTRIESAARDFCRDHTYGSPGLRVWRSCLQAVEEELVMKVNDQRLTAYANTGTVDKTLLAAVPAGTDKG